MANPVIPHTTPQPHVSPAQAPAAAATTPPTPAAAPSHKFAVGQKVKLSDGSQGQVTKVAVIYSVQKTQLATVEESQLTTAE